MTSNFTLCKYNAKREIKPVYYPHSESLEMMAKKEALEARLYPSYAEFEWYNYSSEEQEQIKETLGRIYKNIPQKLYTTTNTISVDDLSNKIYEAMAPQRIVANAGKQEQTVNKDKNK